MNLSKLRIQLSRQTAKVEPISEPIRGSVAICAIMKDEAANLLEWIAYHRVMGVQYFFLYDNGSSDGTAQLLKPLIDAGIVNYRLWDLVPGQVAAYEHCAACAVGNWDWIAFIDIDEFINVFSGSSIQDFLARFPDSAAVAVPWLNFGPSGHDHRPVGLGIANYLYRLPWQADVHRLIKTILRPNNYVSGNNPHSFRIDGRVADERGNETVNGELLYSEQPPHDPEFACINHYYTRSREDYLAKLARGCADVVTDARELAWFEIYSNNATVHDDRIASRIPATRAMLHEFAQMGCELGLLADRVVHE